MKIILDGDFNRVGHFIAANDAIDRFMKSDIFNFRGEDGKSPLLEMNYDSPDNGKISFLVGANKDGFIIYKVEKEKTDT